MCKCSIYEARNKFSALVKQAENGEPVEIERHGKVVAYIISAEEYENNPKSSPYEWWKKWHQENITFLPETGIPLAQRKVESSPDDVLFGYSTTQGFVED